MSARKIIALVLVASMLGAVPATARQSAPFVGQWDLDGDARVTRDEILTRRADIFAMFDENEDGVLAGAELDLMRETSAGQQDAMADTRAEYRAANQAMMQGAQRGARSRGMRGMGHDDVAMADANGDGQITRSEFLALADKMMSIQDSNGDGVIDSQDRPGKR